MRHILPSAGDGDVRTEAGDGARRHGECVLRSDSIKGLAQSIAKPAYRRLLTAEPLLRRAVPVLIIAFLVTICVGAVVQVLDQRRQVVIGARQAIEALGDQLASALDRPAARCPRDHGDAPPMRSSTRCRHGRRSGGRLVLLTDADGRIIASVPNDAQTIGRPMLDVLGRRSR